MARGQQARRCAPILALAPTKHLSCAPKSLLMTPRTWGRSDAGCPDQQALVTATGVVQWLRAQGAMAIMPLWPLPTDALRVCTR